MAYASLASCSRLAYVSPPFLSTPRLLHCFITSLSPLPIHAFVPPRFPAYEYVPITQPDQKNIASLVAFFSPSSSFPFVLPAGLSALC